VALQHIPAGRDTASHAAAPLPSDELLVSTPSAIAVGPRRASAGGAGASGTDVTGAAASLGDAARHWHGQPSSF
jgi:hypothetical protein